MLVLTRKVKETLVISGAVAPEITITVIGTTSKAVRLVVEQPSVRTRTEKKLGENLHIITSDGTVIVTVLSITPSGRIRFGFDGPPTIRVYRGELTRVTPY